MCIASVPLLGGRIGRLSTIRFQRVWAAAAAVAIQVVVLRVFNGGDHAVLAVAHLVSYGLLFHFAFGNLHIPGLATIGLGGLLNAAAIAANNGVMPARPDALAGAGILSVPGEFANSTTVADPKLWYLGDVFNLPADWPMANVFSIGDVVLLIGAFILLQRVCGTVLAPPLDRVVAFWRRGFSRLGILSENRTFRRLWTANAISGIGDWIFPPAVYAAALASDAQSSDLALLLVAQLGPNMLFGLVGGPFIDRFSRKRLMVVTDVLRATTVGSLLLVETPSLAHVYAVSLSLGVGGALFQPAFLASMPNFVDKSQLASANGLVALTQSLAVAVGFLLGGIMVDQLGATWGFTANCLSFVFSALLIARTTVPEGAVRAVTENLITDLAEGFRYVRGHKTARRVIMTVALITLAAGIKSPLEALFALDSLHAGATGLGLLGAVWGLGMIAGSFAASRVDRILGHGRMLTVSVGIVAVAVTLAAMAPVVWPVLILWLFAGVGNTLGTVAYETLLQESTEDAVRGRVMAACEASLQAGLLAGVGIAALTDTLFRDSDPARAGLLLSGGAFAVAAVASWRLVQRHSEAAGAVRAPFAVERVELLPASPAFSLLRLTATGTDAAPVLLVDDGSRVHRLEPLPGAPAADGDARRLGYGIPSALLDRGRSVFALDAGAGPPLDLTLPA